MVITVNPFSQLAGTVAPILMQIFVIIMIALVIVGTLIDIIHKKNVKYFFENAKKAKKSAKKNLSATEKTSVILKTTAVFSLVESFFFADFFAFFAFSKKYLTFFL